MISYPSLVKNYTAYFEKPTRKNYLSLGVTLITIIVLILMIYPAILYILDVSSQLSKNREVSQILTQKILDIQKARDNMSNLTSSLTTIDQALPNSAQLAAYLKTLETSLASSQAVISSLQFNETPLSPAEAKTAPQINSVTYTLTLAGDYTNLRASLDRLEKLSRYTDIAAASFSSKKDATDQLQLILRARTYFYGAVDPSLLPGARQWNFQN